MIENLPNVLNSTTSVGYTHYAVPVVTPGRLSIGIQFKFVGAFALYGTQMPDVRALKI
jgi:hypothetical protein